MAEPIYTTTTERLYRRLPEVYRTLDEQNDWQFKKYLSSIADQLSEIETTIARIEYIPPEQLADYYPTLNQYNTYTRPAGVENTSLGYDPIGEVSDLFDARTADAAWLAYIGQLVGVQLTKIPLEADKRDALINNYLGFRAGSNMALSAAVASQLTGTKYNRIYAQRDGAAGSTTHVGTQWDILIITKTSETPSPSTLVDEIIRKGAKPAGVVLHHMVYTLIWSLLESSFNTWTKIEANLTWENLELGNADAMPL